MDYLKRRRRRKNKTSRVDVDVSMIVNPILNILNMKQLEYNTHRRINTIRK